MLEHILFRSLVGGVAIMIGLRAGLWLRRRQPKREYTVTGLRKEER